MECKAVRDLTQIPKGGDWQYELKFDGYRCIAIKEGKRVELYSRNGRKFNQFPNVAEAVASQKTKTLILDGEIVSLDESGRTDFNALQNVTSGRRAHFFVFDLLRANSKDLKNLPLVDRQGALGHYVTATDFIHLAGPISASVEALAAKVKELGFEGIVAKRRDSIYTPGKQPGTWLKKKIKQTEEFIVGGFVPGTVGVDAILVGRYAEDKLMFAASVDDGFVPATRRKTFQAIENVRCRDVCLFENLPEKKGRHRFEAEKIQKAIWIEPLLVVEIAMNEWTPDGHLRHSEFLRLRQVLKPQHVAPLPG